MIGYYMMPDMGIFMRSEGKKEHPKLSYARQMKRSKKGSKRAKK